MPAAAAGRHPIEKSRPCFVSKRLARMRSIGPSCGTPVGRPGMSSSTRAASLREVDLCGELTHVPVLQEQSLQAVPPPARVS